MYMCLGVWLNISRLKLKWDCTAVAALPLLTTALEHLELFANDINESFILETS